VVMRVLRNIASTGRTVIATIHQPSADLFLMFDDLLLLQRGGYQAYLGPLGYGGAALVSYLTSVPGVAPMAEGMNPSSFMLDALAGTDSSSGGGSGHAAAQTPTVPVTAAAVTSSSAPASSPPAALASPAGAADAAAAPDAAAAAASKMLPGKMLQETLRTSATWAAASKVLADASTPASGATALTFASSRARSLLVQFRVLAGRHWTSYQRNVGLNYGRLVALVLLNVVFGTVWYKAAQGASDVGGVQTLVAGAPPPPPPHDCSLLALAPSPPSFLPSFIVARHRRTHPDPCNDTRRRLQESS